jgi:tripartite-type tricarboxylate transporter receptor subunit TctC
LLTAWFLGLAGFTLAATAVPVRAQSASDYPAKPIHLVIVYAPGGGLDIVGRVVADRLGRNLGHHVVVENRPGAGGNIGTASLVNAPADGYTVLETTNSYNINAFIYRNPGYDPRKDFTPVVQLTAAPSVIVAHPRTPYRTVKDLVNGARAEPGKLTYGSAGNGSPTHIAAELFESAAGIQLTHVPYKSAAQSHMDVMGGQIPLAMAALPSVIKHIQAGSLYAIAVTTPKRSPRLPDVPTIAESGYPGFSHVTWIGIFVPAGTPQAIISRLNKEIVATLSEPEVRDRISAIGADPVGGSPADFEAMLKTDYDVTGKLVARIGLKVD